MLLQFFALELYRMSLQFFCYRSCSSSHQPLGVSFRSSKYLVMPSSKFPSRKMAVLIGVLLAIEVLFDPISIIGNFIKTSKAKSDLATAQQQWEANGSENYKIKLRGAVPVACLYYDAILTVREGQLVDVKAKEFFKENSQYTTLEKEKWNDCEYETLIVSEMLKHTESALERIDPFRQRPHIAFDPKFGYVTYYQINYRGYGLFTWLKVSDCCSWYEFSDYELLEQTELFQRMSRAQYKNV